jgi:hypothetical protein
MREKVVPTAHMNKTGAFRIPYCCSVHHLEDRAQLGCEGWNNALEKAIILMVA